MNKQEYLGALEYALAQMPPEEREKHLAWECDILCHTYQKYTQMNTIDKNEIPWCFVFIFYRVYK